MERIKLGMSSLRTVCTLVVIEVVEQRTESVGFNLECNCRERIPMDVSALSGDNKSAVQHPLQKAIVGIYHDHPFTLGNRISLPVTFSAKIKESKLLQCYQRRGK